MEGIWHALIYAAWTVIRFIGLTVFAAFSLAISILINTVAITYMQLWLPVPGFLIQTPSFSLLDFISRLLGLSGS